MTKINDSLESVKTSLGRRSENRDYKAVKYKKNSYWLNVYRSSWLAEKIIDKTARDMCKKWRDSKGADTEKLNQLRALEEKLNIPKLAEEALVWGSLFGEVLIIAITDANEDLYSSELGENEQLERLLVVDEYQIGEIDENIFSPTFGEPTYYKVGEVDIHPSRACRLVAGKLPFSQIKKNARGISDLNSKIEIIKAFDTISTAVSDLIEESKIDIFKMAGFNEQIAAGQEEFIVKYVQLAQEIKSQNDALLVDKEDEYAQKEISFTGLSDLWVKSREVVAGALDRPITVVFGQSASGFASGEEDNKAYYGTILSLQESRLRPLLDFVDKFLLPMAGIDSNTFSYEFPSIDSMNKLDEASIFNTYATGMSTLFQHGLLSGEQVLRELKHKDIFSNVTEGDILKAKELDNDYNQPADAYQITAQGAQQSPLSPDQG